VTDDNESRLARWRDGTRLINENLSASPHVEAYSMLRYLLQSLLHGNVPDPQPLLDLLDDKATIPPCGHLACPVTYEHTH
jgi:hypothetical protein